jgi:FKBP-type peptidyl-prolyl cis-trans isomerase
MTEIRTLPMPRLDSLGISAVIAALTMGCGPGGDGLGTGGTGPRQGQAGSAGAQPGKADSPLNEPTKIGEHATTFGGVIYETMKEGQGRQVSRPDERVTIHYTGTFEDGKVFDSSRDRGGPWTFDLGSELAPLGLNHGIVGMKVGERRKITLPPNVGYGALGTFNKEYAPGVKDVTGSLQTGTRPLIPPNSTVIFDVELIDAGGKPEGD